jgi:hypothetical protein
MATITSNPIAPVPTLRTLIADDIMASSSEYITRMRVELAFALAVRSAMQELEGKSVTRRICGKIADILGWNNAIITLIDSDQAFISWTLTAWGGETGRQHGERLTAWLGSREGLYSPKCVNFEGWSTNSCRCATIKSAIAEHEAVTREHAEALADALIAVHEAQERFAALACGSPVSSYAEDALKRHT